MKEFSPLVAPVYAFFSRALYADAARRWRIGAFVYLLVLVTISVIPFLVGIQTGLSKFLRDDVPAFTAQIPPVRIEGGVVHVAVEQPYIIRDTGKGEPLAIIDTTGTVTSLEDTPASILVTRTQVFIKKNDAETRVYDLGAIQHFEVDGARVEKWLTIIAAWGPLILLPLAIIGVYLYRTVQALFFSLFALLIAHVLGRRLAYGSILNITLVALGPVILIGTVLSVAGVKLPLAWLIYFLIAMAYTAFGIASTPDADVAGPDAIER